MPLGVFLAAALAGAAFFVDGVLAVGLSALALAALGGASVLCAGGLAAASLFGAVDLAPRVAAGWHHRRSRSNGAIQELDVGVRYWLVLGVDHASAQRENQLSRILVWIQLAARYTLERIAVVAGRTNLRVGRRIALLRRARRSPEDDEERDQKHDEDDERPRTK